MAGIMDIYKAIEYFGGVFTTQDIIKYTGDVNNASKYLCMLRKRGEIDSIDSILHIGIGNRPKIWVKYDDETRPLPRDRAPTNAYR